MNQGTTNATDARTRVKICGITRLEDAAEAVKGGADFLGYVFYPKSVRNVAPATAAAMIREIRLMAPAVHHVGVFVNESLEQVRRIATEAGFDFAQLHGNETPEMCAAIVKSGLRVIKSFRFGGDENPPAWNAFDVDYFLCDTYHPQIAGGTGVPFNHALLPPGFPLDRVLVAGGLTPANVSDIISRLKPFGVDVSSSLEIAPGIKSAGLIQEFLSAAKQ